MFEYAIIREYYNTGSSSYVYNKGWEESVEDICEGILLFPNMTARTNVMLKDSRGRFVSYKEIGGDIEAAMEMILPFPRGE